MQTARAVVYDGPRQLSVRDYPFPKLGADDLLVEVLLAGIDGSEVHMFRGELERINDLAPLVMGDEMVGRVVEIGSRAAEDRGLEVGDRVVVEARWPCSDCPSCRRGQYYLCTRHDWPHGYGWISAIDAPHLWGAYSTHAYVPREALVYRVPEELPTDVALLCGSVLANSLRWTEVGDIGLGSNVAVIGPGPQGIGCAILAAERGAKVVIVGLPVDETRLQAASRLCGAETLIVDPKASVLLTKEQIRGALDGVAPDVVIEAAGVQAAKDLAVASVRSQGTIVNIALTSPSRLSVDWLTLLLHEITLLNPHAHPHIVPDALNAGVAMLDRGIELGSMITHRYSLDEVETALKVAALETDEHPIKVVLVPPATRS